MEVRSRFETIWGAGWVLPALVVACAMAFSLSAATVPAEARTAFPAHGGPGDASVPDECQRGWYLIGFKGRVGAWIDQIALVCARFNPDNSIAEREDLPARGGSGGGPMEVNCPRGFIISGVKYRMTEDYRLVGNVSANCVPLTGSGKSHYIYFGNTDDSISKSRSKVRPPDQCEPGDAAVGMQINYGKHVNAAGLICDELIKPVAATSGPIICKPGEVYRDRFNGDGVCVQPDERWKMADGSCRAGYVKLGVGSKKDVCGTPQMKEQAEINAAASVASTAKDKLRSGNPQDFHGTWNTTRKGEAIVLTLRVEGTSVAGKFTHPARPESNGTLTGTIKTYDGNFGPIVKLSYKSTQPIEANGSFDVFTDGKLEGGYSVQEPGKTKRTFYKWTGARASN